ncbi:TetR family transcriptional regulator [Sneathiella sp. P13V-1]|uniref:TetR/AcrR family transcriptional regulator n=1 Tax=Sneathiella sp. P13V-1 TaxID=2697366 RepID=UPI00187B505A|nr:TetR/AcrR family transcriptional regulator [Sneathiella sp. P13V-1]MBE7637878.1 TetR family transcriptional regulator [Sneathiella sp. P13V-1]
MSRSAKREQLIEVASELFNKYGYHAAGIDRVIEESGIAKTTLYRHFPSKEDLIVAVLKKLDMKYRDEMREFVEGRASGDQSRLLLSFDFLEKWFEDSSFFGCPFISAAGEYGSEPCAIMQEATLHKRLVIAFLEEMARLDGCENPVDVAEEMNLLHEGATAVAHITKSSEPAMLAKETASKLLEN